MPQAVLFSRYGKPSEVIEVVIEPLHSPGPRQVVVEQIVAPINPADLNTIEGLYPANLTLPATPGIEGAGTVTEAGAEAGLAAGTQVLLPRRFGSWREAAVLDADQLIEIPRGVPLFEAAMLRANPGTAWLMLREFVPPVPGAWVVQNAANSAVGRHVIAIARELGLRTVNLVRRQELIPELTEAGADAVVLDDGDARDAVAAATGGEPILLGLNAVGGESALRMTGMLAGGGTLVTYGAMSRQAMKLPAGPLIFNDLRLRGFWFSRWYEEVGQARLREVLDELFQLAIRGVIHTEVKQTYRISEARDAVIHAAQGARGGKILFDSTR